MASLREVCYATRSPSAQLTPDASLESRKNSRFLSTTQYKFRTRLAFIMLSNQQHQPARPMARRLLKHERQRSTPVVSTLQPESTSYFPEITYTQGITLQRQAPIGHRRGLSLDPSMRLQDLRLTPTRSPLGNNGMVSTNQGPVYQQQKMREAQMHGLSCPGHIDRELGNIMEDSSMINNTNANFASLNEADAAFAACFGSIMNAQGTQSAERSQSRPYTPINITMNGMLMTRYSNHAYKFSTTESVLCFTRHKLHPVITYSSWFNRFWTTERPNDESNGFFPRTCGNETKPKPKFSPCSNNEYQHISNAGLCSYSHPTS